MKISLRIETKNHNETALGLKHVQEQHETDTWHALCASALAFLGGLADRAASERERARGGARLGRGPAEGGAALEKHLEQREEAAAAARERARLQCENSQLRAQVRVLEDMLAAIRDSRR